MAQEGDPYRLEELAAREEKALAMGGPEKVARQHGKGLLTVRERVEKLVDPGTFDEVGLLLHSDLSGAGWPDTGRRQSVRIRKDRRTHCDGRRR